MATKTDEVSTYDSASMYVRVSDLSRSTIFWNCSSIGRALPCHGKGRGIETLQFRQFQMGVRMDMHEGHLPFFVRKNRLKGRIETNLLPQI